MPTYTVNQFYLGQFAEMDTVEATNLLNANSTIENLAVANLGGGPNWAIGSVFGGDALQMTTIIQNDIVRDGVAWRLEEDDYANLGLPVFQRDADSYTYDIGAGPVTSAIDSVSAWNVEILLGDGTTVTKSISIVQLQNGAIFTNPADAFNGLRIQSFKIVSHTSSDYYGTPNNRTITDAEIVCFAAGTQILTERGEMAIEDIAIGDMVQTLDHGLQPVRWIGCRRMDSIDLAANPKLKPIRIAAGCLGGALPHRDLLVSPQHRILVRSKIAQRMFGTQEVLGAAKQFLRLEGFDIVQDVAAVTYYHMLFDQHEIIFAEGAPSESLFTGPVALDSVGAEARDEILAIMPGIAEAGREIEGARMLLSGRPARKLASRHLQNRRLLLADA